MIIVDILPPTFVDDTVLTFEGPTGVSLARPDAVTARKIQCANRRVLCSSLRNLNAALGSEGVNKVGDSGHVNAQQTGLGEEEHTDAKRPLLGATVVKVVDTALMAPLRRIAGTFIPLAVTGEEHRLTIEKVRKVLGAPLPAEQLHALRLRYCKRIWRRANAGWWALTQSHMASGWRSNILAMATMRVMLKPRLDELPDSEFLVVWEAFLRNWPSQWAQLVRRFLVATHVSS